MNTLFRRSMALVLVCALSGCAMVSPELKPDVPVAGARRWVEAMKKLGMTPVELQGLLNDVGDGRLDPASPAAA